MDELLGQLRGGQHDSEGTFTIDPQRALAILKQHQFLEPSQYVLPLYQAAISLGATELSVVPGADRCRFELPGATLEAPQHRTLAGQLLKSSGGLRLLAMAVFTALNLPRARVEVTGDRVRSLWTPDEYKQEPAEEGPVAFEIRGEVPPPDLSRCLYGSVPLSLHGVTLPPPPLPPNTVLWRRLAHDEKLPPWEPRGQGVEVRAGWSGLLTYGLDGPGEVVLVAAGLTAPERLPAPEGVGGVLSSARLRWDISWQHPVQDDLYREMAQSLAELDPELARQAALSGGEGPALRELIFRNLRRLRKGAPPELWEARLFQQVAGDPLSLRQIAAAPPPLRYTKRFWEFARPTGAVQLRSGQELGILSSFVTVEDGDAWLERRRAAEEREAQWREAEPREARLKLPFPPSGGTGGGLGARGSERPGVVALEGYAGEVAFGEGGLTLLKESRYLGKDQETLPVGVAGIVNCDSFTPDDDWAGARHDAIWRRMAEALERALRRLYERAPAEPPRHGEELVIGWLQYWASRTRPAGWDNVPLALWPVFPTQTGVRLSWADLRSAQDVWFVEEPIPPRLPRVAVKVLQIKASVRKLLGQFLGDAMKSLLDQHPERPKSGVIKRGPIPAAKLLLRQKVMRGDLAVPWEPQPPYLGPPGLELHVSRQGAHLGSLWLPLGYGPIVADVELPGVQARDGHLVQGEAFQQEMKPIYERCRKLAIALASGVHRYSDQQWAAVRLYLLRQLAHERGSERTDEVWGVLSKSPLFPCADGQNVGYADFLLQSGEIGWVDEPTTELPDSPLLLLEGEGLELTQRILGERLVDRRPELARLRQQQGEVVMFVTLPPGETILEVPYGLEGHLGLLRDPGAVSRLEFFEGRRRVQAVDVRLPIPLVAAVERCPLEDLQAEARRLVREHDELPEEYRVEVALADPGLHDVPVVTGLLRPLALRELTGETVRFLTPKTADRIYGLSEIEPFLEALGYENPPILSKGLERVLPWPLEDLALSVERAFWKLEGRAFPPVLLEDGFPGRRWLARSPLVGKLLGEIGLPEDWRSGQECVWLLPRGRVRVPGPVCGVVWSEHDLPDERIREAVPLLAQTLRKDLLRRVPRPELEAWCGE